MFHQCRKVVERDREEVEAGLVEFGEKLAEVAAAPLGEGGLEVGQLRHARPAALVGRAHGAEDAEQLVDLGIARKQRPALDLPFQERKW